MSDSALRRPLLWLLLAYMAALCWLRARGAFEPRLAPGDERWAGRTAALDAVADGPEREELAGWKLEARATAADGRPFPYRVLLRWPRSADPDALPWPGQEVRVSARLRRPRPPGDPGDFDERALLAERGIAWVAEAGVIVARGRVSGLSPRYWAERLHRSTRSRLRGLLPADRARLLEGFTLGYKGALAPKLKRAVQDAGLIHWLVPSGAKVALALALTAWLAARLRLGPAAAALGAASAGGAIVLAAGAEPPYWRAWSAAVVLLAARALGRETDAFQTLLAAAWLELLLRPRDLFSAGFQMTYAAVAALLAFGPALWRLCARVSPRPLRLLAAAVGASAVVQAALWPIFAATFGRGSRIGVLVNALAAPAGPLLAAAGWALWAATFAGRPVAAAVAPAVSAALGAFERLCVAAAAVPGAAAPLAAWPRTSTAAYYLALVGLSRRTPARAAAWLAAALAVRAAGAWLHRSADDLRVVFLKVPPLAGRRRSAALVTFDGRRTWLIGEAPAGLAARACRAYGVDGLDGELPGAPGLRLCRGASCLRFDPPGPVSAQSAIIALPSEIHVRFPR